MENCVFASRQVIHQAQENHLSRNCQTEKDILQRRAASNTVEASFPRSSSSLPQLDIDTSSKPVRSALVSRFQTD